MARQESSYIQLRGVSRHEGQSLSKGQFKHSNTRWLDGLRGFAALIVVFHHFGLAFWHQTVYAWGTQVPVGFILDRQPFLPYAKPVPDHNLEIISEVQDNYSILQLPIIRLIVSGDPMVAIFFIVSGYSLSIKPLSLVRKGLDSQGQLLSAISSAAFRRPIRLLLPVIFSTFMVAVAAGIGLYSYAAAETKGPYEHMHLWFHGWVLEPVPPIEATFFIQMQDWMLSTSEFLDFFSHTWSWSAYDRHAWTIPLEFRCSYFLFMTQVATAMFGSSVRLTILAVLVAGAFTWGATWEMALFWSGMALCEINMIRDSADITNRVVTNTHLWTKRGIKAAVLFIGLYVATIPGFQSEFTPMYSFLNSIHMPGRPPIDHRTWVAIGALMIVSVVSRTVCLKNFFSNRLAKYLGRISFALYLVHGPVLRGLGYTVAVLMWKCIGNYNWYRYNVAVGITMAITLPVIFALSHLFCVTIDEPIVRLARWMESRLKQLTSMDKLWEPASTFEEVRMLDAASMGDGYLDSPSATTGLFSIEEKDEDDSFLEESDKDGGSSRILEEGRMAS
ncbi:hypothetical protein ANO11243_038520 [Dothideomycetidae sp. 11243]|nr:hypothetical protein ANO11243_038520 [fungal sp. No.11243]